MPSPHFNASDDANVFDFLSKACDQLNNRSIGSNAIGRTIRQIYGALRSKRNMCSRNQWQEFVTRCRDHSFLEVMHRDAFSRRSFDKPRGYAGDAVLLDYIYGSEQFWTPPEMDWVGQRIHRWTTVCSACQGVKSRRGIIARMIDQLADKKRDAEVLSLAAGHFREAEISSAIIRRRLGRAVAIDSDLESLDLVDQAYAKYGVQTVHATARELISGRFETGAFDLIYCSGLCDYLSGSLCQKLTAQLFAKLKPGGSLLLTNFLEDIEAIGYMEIVMDWNLIYRDRIDMIAITKKIPQREIANLSVFCEENLNVIFLLLQRCG